MRFLIALCLLGAVAALPTFPNDWSAGESAFLIVYQGDFKVSNAMYCCPDPSNCQIQTQAFAGKHYFDYTHNRTRFDYTDPTETIVNDYALGMEMEVDENLVCVEYCPLDDDLSPYSIDPAAKDNGAVVISGKKYENWTWQETIFDIIVMESIAVLVDQSTTPATPFYERDELTPFGQDLGYEEVQYSNFKGGAQDPKLFAVTGQATCEMSPNCGNLKRQHVRLRDRAHKTYLREYQLEKAEQKKRNKRPSKFLL